MKTKSNSNPYTLYNKYNSELKPNSLVAKKTNKAWLGRLAKQDAISTNNKTHGNFECPNCQHYYNLSFGVYGKISTFGESTYFCKDCVKTSLLKTFVKMG